MAKFPMLSAEQIANAFDLKEVEMDVPEWQSSLKLRAFNVDERDKVMAAATEKDDKINRMKLLRLIVVHGVVEPKLTLDIVSNKNFAVIERIAMEIMALNGMQTEKGPSAATVADVTF